VNEGPRLSELCAHIDAELRKLESKGRRVRPSSRKQLDLFIKQWFDSTAEERIEFAAVFAVLLHRFIER
jgi:hypothetical protein